MEINIVLTESFEKWLQTLEYAESTVYASVRYVNDFFLYLKSCDINSLEQISPAMINHYYQYLQKKPLKKKTGGLSQNYIVSNINAIKRFNRYLQLTGRDNMDITLQTPVDKNNHRMILNQQEVKTLYQACTNDYLGQRDRALLGIYYGCGLRRNEGINLDVKDIQIKEKLIYVRAGKGYRERYVPMTRAVRDDLEAYICQGREYILGFKKNVKTDALLLSTRVKRICGNQVLARVQKLVQSAGINKTIGLHSLRHSIATHLLQSGMTLEEVREFLGHSSLESTQIYTHLAYE